MILFDLFYISVLVHANVSNLTKCRVSSHGTSPWVFTLNDVINYRNNGVYAGTRVRSLILAASCRYR